MLLLHIKRMVKNPVLCICIIGMLFGLICDFFVIKGDYVYWGDEIRLDLQGPLFVTNSTIQYCFLIFMGLSYMTFYSAKKVHLEESLQVVKGGLLRDQLYDFFILVIINVVVTSIICAYIYWNYLKNNVNDITFFLYIFRMVILCYTLVYMLAIIIGWVFSCINNRLLGISLLVFTSYIFGEYFISLILTIDPLSELFWKIGTLFSINHQDLSKFSDMSYLLSLENVHFYRVLFWIFLFVTVLVVFRTKNKYLIIIPVFLTAINLIMFFQPSGASYALPYQNAADSWLYTQYYYRNWPEESVARNAWHEKENKDDFTVVSYDMDIHVSDILSAEVSVIPDIKNLQEYQFTLYHEYEVLEVTDQDGNPLEFEQDSDFLLIKNTSSELESINFKYRGSCQYFYATTQGIKLPAFFEYYPVAGWHTVFYCDQEVEYVNQDTNFSTDLMKNECDFHVSLNVKGKYPIYSNFIVTGGEKDDGYYKWELEGRSNGLTIVGSPYLEEYTLNDVRIIYSRLDETNSPKTKLGYESYQKAFDELDEMGISIEGKTIIVPPYGNYNMHFIASDYIMGEAYIMSKEIYNYYDHGSIYDKEERYGE